MVYLDEKTMPKDSEGSTGSSYIVDRKNRKVLIPIDVNKIEDIKKVLGTLTEEVAHGKDALEGRQDKKVAEDKSNDEEGLESLGRPANEYVKKRFGEDNNSEIKLTTDGIDLSNADVGEKVGDVNTQDDRNSGYAEILPSQQRDPWLNKMNFKLLRLRKNTDEFVEETLISSFYLQMRAYSILSDSGETIRDFTLGALKAGGEDLSLNTYKIPKRFQYNTLAYKNGELFGHFTMSVIGILGTIIGSGMEGIGTAAAPATGGVSFGVAVAGIGVETYSAGVGATASTNFAKTSLEKKAMKSEGGSSDNNSNKSIEDTKNLEKEENPKNRNLEEAASKVQETSQRIKLALKKDKTIIEVTRDGKRMYYDTKSKCYFYVDKTHSYTHYEIFDRTGKHLGVLNGEELETLLEKGGKITSIIDETGAVSGRRIKVK